MQSRGDGVVVGVGVAGTVVLGGNVVPHGLDCFTTLQVKLQYAT